MNLITIKESTIHGRGVFAARDITIGETVINWDDCTNILSQTDALSLPAEERKYLSIIDGKYIQFKPPARFVNHSCEPTARGTIGRDIALRNISVGEEITVDYAAENVPDLDLICHCGAKSCRKILKS